MCWKSLSLRPMQQRKKLMAPSKTSLCNLKPTVAMLMMTKTLMNGGTKKDIIKEKISLTFATATRIVLYCLVLPCHVSAKTCCRCQRNPRESTKHKALEWSWVERKNNRSGRRRHAQHKVTIELHSFHGLAHIYIRGKSRAGENKHIIAIIGAINFLSLLLEGE